MLGESATDLGLHGVPHTAGGLCAASTRSSLLGVLIDEVASATTADVVVWCLVIHHLLLASKLLIEAEDGTLGLSVDVASTATASAEVGIWLRRSELASRCWAGGVCTSGEVVWVDADHVAGAATAIASHVGSWDRWVWLGDAVVTRHCVGVDGDVVV